MLGDLDGDGDVEVVVGSGDSLVYAWHHNGTSVAGWPQSTGGFVGFPPALGDLDGDGTLEVVSGSDDNKVYAWHSNGTAVAGWPQTIGMSAHQAKPVIGDLDRDGDVEVVAAGDGIYAWTCDLPTSDLRPWLMFHHDGRHTGTYRVRSDPWANFSAIPRGGVAPLTVAFSDLSTNDPTAWSWEFGDGAISTAQHPGHTYTTPGTFTVRLTASKAGESDTAAKRAYITVTFPDLPLDHWACDYVLACVSEGIVFGYPDGSYQPDESVTRGQMAIYMARAVAGGDEGVPDGPPIPTFPDVPTSDICYKYIEYAVASQIVFGYQDGSYWPGYEVDRGTMAVFVARATATPLGEPGMVGYVPPLTPTFPDVTQDPLDPYQACYKYVEYIAEHEVTHGYPDGLYHPEYVVNRGLMAMYVARAFGLL